MEPKRGEYEAEFDDSKDKERLEMETGEKEEDAYTDTGRDKLVEDDEMSPAEEGFMEGEDTGMFADCPKCGKGLSEDKEKLIETKIKGEKMWFCSEECMNEYIKEQGL